MRKYILISAMLILLIAGCSRGELLIRNYYILDYMDHTETTELIQADPIDLNVFIMDARVSNTYNRNQIVVRHFGPRITYSYYDLWGVKLSKIVPNLLQTKLQNYNIFQRSSREVLSSKPDLEIVTILNNIELYQSDRFWQARVNIEFMLRKVGSDRILVQHSSNNERRLAEESMDTFVQIANEILLEEMDKFVLKILAEFKDQGEIELPLATEESLRIKLEAIQKEAEEIHEGFGLLYLPALSKTENEPYFLAETEGENEEVYSGLMGEPLPLPSGKYTIYYGSGQINDRMKMANVEIIPRYKTIIEPDWGCLIIDVIDEDRNYAKVRYEIYDLESGQSFGSGFPAEEEIGEQPVVYVLKPGYYKITINNVSFNTYRDFTTTLIETGEIKKLTIVVETDEDGNPLSMVGAGVLEESFLQRNLGRLRFSSAVHGYVNLNSDNENDEKTHNTTISLNSQFQNYLIYDYDKFHYSMKNLIEIGTSKSSDQDFRLASDEFDLKNTAIYYFMKNLGIYSRFDINSHFFSSSYYSSEDFYGTKIDIDGNVVVDSLLVNDIKISSPLFPMVLKEGFGINYRILNQAKAKLSLRAGFGMRQELNNDVYRLSKIENAGNKEYREYHEIDSESKTGTEISVVGSFILPWNISYSTNADFLFPFGEEEDYTMEWENVFNLRLLKYISLDYKLKLIHKMPDMSDDYISRNHTLFLRISFFLR